MDTQVIVTYIVCDEVIKAIGVEHDRQARICTAEIITFSIIAGQLLGGNHRKACWFCSQAPLSGHLERGLKSRAAAGAHLLPGASRQGSTLAEKLQSYLNHFASP